jgi:hypothetical protein
MEPRVMNAWSITVLRFPKMVTQHVHKGPDKKACATRLEPKDAYDPLVKPSKKRFYKVT